MALSGTAMQMEAVALGWLVLIRTDSPVLVVLIASARKALSFMALFSGATAERVPRHRLVAAVMFTISLPSLAMFTLLQSGRLEVWHIRFDVVADGHALCADCSGCPYYRTYTS